MVAVQIETSQEDVACRRRYGRALLSISSSIILPDESFPCRLEDLSLDGARVSIDQQLEPGDSLWLKLDRLKAFGTVRWVAGGECGIEFKEHLPKAMILKIQGHSVKPEDYAAMEAKLAAGKWLVGDGASKSVPEGQAEDDEAQSRDKQTSRQSGDRTAGRSKNALFKRFDESYGTKRMRVAKYLAYAAIYGALFGVASAVFR